MLVRGTIVGVVGVAVGGRRGPALDVAHGARSRRDGSHDQSNALRRRRAASSTRLLRRLVGHAVLIMTEAMMFVGLLASYFFLWASSDEWPQAASSRPSSRRIALFTVMLLGSSIPIFWAEAGEPARRRMTLGAARLFVSFAHGRGVPREPGARVPGTPLRLARQRVRVDLLRHRPGCTACTCSSGLLINLVVQAKAYAGPARPPTAHVTVEVFSLYWHFVDVVWIFVFSVALPGASFRMNVQTTTRGPTRRQIVLGWTATTLPIGAWIVHLTGEAALVRLACEHRDVEWVMHGLTVVTALVCVGVPGHRRVVRRAGRPARAETARSASSGCWPRASRS